MSSLGSIGNSAVVNSLLSNTPTVTGLASGLDTNKIIQGLLAIRQGQIDNLQSNLKNVSNQQTAFKSIEARLLTVQADIGNLARSQNGAFDLRTVTSSDTDLLTAAAGNSATPGIYTLHVNTLAAAHQVASQGFDATTTQITQGAYQIASGSSHTTITIDNTNNTLQGLADAINNAKAGVAATIINDGSGAGNQPYRLVLTASKTGLANAITVTGPGAGAPAFDTTLQAAADASVTLGTGSGALTVHHADNQINDLIAGVTLNLLDANANQAITLSIANDTSKASDAIQGFVKDFNDLMSFIDDQVRYDPTTGQAGILLGDFQVTQIQDQLRNLMGGLVNTGNANMNHLGDLGITFNDQGQLSLDQSKLASALSGGQSGVTLDSIRRLFALTATSSDPGVQFITGSTKTTGSSIPYQVNITQAATQATLTATNAPASSITIDNTNNVVDLAVDGVDSGTITLTAGTYTQDALAQELQTQINAQTNLAGRQVAVTVAGGKLTITSNSFGSSSRVAMTSGSALSALGFDGTETATGQDVAGNFIVNGTVENAVGSGQVLIGNSANSNTSGLQVRVTLTPSQVGSGTQTNLTVTRGLASLIDVALKSFLDPINGRLKSVDDGFQAQEDSINQEIARQTDSMQNEQQSLQQQFTAMEQAISQLQSIGNYLTMQFNSATQQTQKIG